MHPGSDLLAIARTDAEAATLITTTIDPRDHAFILGSTNPNLQPLNDLMVAAERAGKAGDALQAIEDKWLAQANLKRFDDAVLDAIAASGNATGLADKYRAAVQGKQLSNAEARAVARGILGKDVYFDWDAPRTREGYYRLKGGCDCSVNRAIAYAPYCDAIWMESKLPDFKQAEEFARGVHAVWPEQKSVPPLFLTFFPLPLFSLTTQPLPDSPTTSPPPSTGRRRCRAPSKRLTSSASPPSATAGSSSRSRACTPPRSSATASPAPTASRACVRTASSCRSPRWNSGWMWSSIRSGVGRRTSMSCRRWLRGA